jgi:hypothetical protein
MKEAEFKLSELTAVITVKLTDTWSTSTETLINSEAEESNWTLNNHRGTVINFEKQIRAYSRNYVFHTQIHN